MASFPFWVVKTTPSHGSCLRHCPTFLVLNFWMLISDDFWWFLMISEYTLSSPITMARARSPIWPFWALGDRAWVSFSAALCESHDPQGLAVIRLPGLVSPFVFNISYGQSLFFRCKSSINWPFEGNPQLWATYPVLEPRDLGDPAGSFPRTRADTKAAICTGFPDWDIVFSSRTP